MTLFSENFKENSVHAQSVDEKLFNFANFYLLLADNNRHWHSIEEELVKFRLKTFPIWLLLLLLENEALEKEKKISPFLSFRPDSIPLYSVAQKKRLFSTRLKSKFEGKSGFSRLLVSLGSQSGIASRPIDPLHSFLSSSFLPLPSFTVSPTLPPLEIRATKMEGRNEEKEEIGGEEKISKAR